MFRLTTIDSSFVTTPSRRLQYAARLQKMNNDCRQLMTFPWWLLWFLHDDVIKWKHFPRNWPFVRGIHRSPVNSPHKGQWRGALMFTLICARIDGWVNTREAGDLRRYRPHYDVIVMIKTHHEGLKDKLRNTFSLRLRPCLTWSNTEWKRVPSCQNVWQYWWHSYIYSYLYCRAWYRFNSIMS